MCIAIYYSKLFSVDFSSYKTNCKKLLICLMFTYNKGQLLFLIYIYFFFENKNLIFKVPDLKYDFYIFYSNIFNVFLIHSDLLRKMKDYYLYNYILYSWIL